MFSLHFTFFLCSLKVSAQFETTFKTTNYYLLRQGSLMEKTDKETDIYLDSNNLLTKIVTLQ